jgi:hypothetical protein
MADDAAILSFCEITSAEPAVAARVLEIANNDVEAAVQLFFEHPELQTAPPSTSTAGTGTTRPGRPAVGREDERGVIHIDSDDDDDADDRDYMDDDGGNVQAAVRIAQEDEDAAMARRLQEEMYSGTGGNDDSVRSPIARRTETLLGDDWDQEGGEPHHALYDMMQRQRARQAARAPNPFNQSIWTEATPVLDPAASSREPGLRGPVTTSYANAHQQRLAELFRPPFDIMTRLDWDDARDAGKASKRWIMVNLQDMSIFGCQALNRDIWSNASIKDIIGEHFVFLQYSRTEALAAKYLGFYFPSNAHENQDIYPHVCIIDPRTGEQVKVWSGTPFPNAEDFHAQLVEFLDRYSLHSGSKNPVIQETQRTRAIDVDRMTEDEMLEMALKNSLVAEGGGEGSSGANANRVVDPDELTKTPTRQQQQNQQQADAQPTARDPTPAPPSAFAQISSSAPHTEPAASEPSTRIQFRHPNGRVIRRFLLADRVQRIYEWLKAEPIEGIQPADGDGGGAVEFELKVMPAGTDLVEKLDETIEEAGLKNGTVLIEFISE